MIPHKTLLSFGHGFSAKALDEILLPQGWHIIGTSRSEEGVEKLKKRGVDGQLWGADLGAEIGMADAILTSVSPSEGGDPVLALYGEALRDARPAWLGYLSTTGVYGDHQGGWVDEDTPLTPATKRGIWRKRAEAEWQALPTPPHIFRLAGIYGPGRGPFAKVRAGTARRIIKKNQIFSRIHVEDIATVLAASIAAPNPGRIYNLCDDDPAPPEDVLAYAAELLGLPIPPAVNFEAADMTPMARSFYAESKRVRNTRIKDELGIQLRYPDYKTGLKALLERTSESTPR